MKRLAYFSLGAVAVLGIAAFSIWPRPPATADTSEPERGAAMVAVNVPAPLSDLAVLGRTAFNAVCAECHGENAAGRFGFGPPLIHRLYEPSHHADIAFQLAAAQGVQAHHWRFGDMPPQPDVTRGDVVAIVAYVREMQRANGIE